MLLRVRASTAIGALLLDLAWSALAQLLEKPHNLCCCRSSGMASAAATMHIKGPSSFLKRMPPTHLHVGAAAGNVGDATAQLKKVASYIKSSLPFFNRSMGADHFVLLPSDFGACGISEQVSAGFLTGVPCRRAGGWGVGWGLHAKVHSFWASACKRARCLPWMGSCHGGARCAVSGYGIFCVCV
jgi:hypothetical protein